MEKDEMMMKGAKEGDERQEALKQISTSRQDSIHLASSANGKWSYLWGWMEESEYM